MPPWTSRAVDLVDLWSADDARLVELLSNHGPAIGMPHSRALGRGLAIARQRSKEFERG